MSEVIRKMTCVDIRQIRKLPVQLAHPATAVLPPRKLRHLMYDRNYRLLVCERDEQVAAFAGLNFRAPSGESGYHFLVMDWFAVDRFAFQDGLAAEIEAHATAIAKEKAAVAILVGYDGLPAKAKKFYAAQGYILNGNTLIKEL